MSNNKSKLDELLLSNSQAAGGSSGRAILILESDIPTLIAEIKDLIKELAAQSIVNDGDLGRFVAEIEAL